MWGCNGLATDPSSRPRLLLFLSPQSFHAKDVMRWWAALKLFHQLRHWRTGCTVVLWIEDGRHHGITGHAICIMGIPIDYNLIRCGNCSWTIVEYNWELNNYKMSTTTQTVLMGIEYKYIIYLVYYIIVSIYEPINIWTTLSILPVYFVYGRQNCMGKIMAIVSGQSCRKTSVMHFDCTK